MAEFTADLQALLAEMTNAGKNYWPSVLEGYSDDIEHVAKEVLDRRRWVVNTLDVYRRKADGALAGIRWDAPATEEQEGQERYPEVVKVEQVMRTTYRVVQ